MSADSVCVCGAGNVHVSWMNPDVAFDTRRSSFPNLQRRNIYTGDTATHNRTATQHRQHCKVLTKTENPNVCVCVCVCGAGYSVVQALRLLSQEEETIVTGNS